MKQKMTDYDIVDWMEDNPEKAIKILEAEAKSFIHGLRERVEEFIRESCDITTEEVTK